MSDEVPAALLAMFDQAHALINKNLDDIIEVHRHNVHANKIPWEFSVTNMAGFAYDELNHSTLARLFAVAVHRLATRERQ